MESVEKKEGQKRLYEKPSLRTIELASEEVLGVGCKLSSGGFAIGVTPCTAGSCTGLGS